MPEHVAECRASQRCGRQLELARLIERRATGRVSIGCDTRRRVQREDRRVAKPAKRSRLRRPVEVSKRSCERVEMMFRPIVIAVHGGERRLTRLELVDLCGQQHSDLIIPLASTALSICGFDPRWRATWLTLTADVARVIPEDA